MSYCRFGEGDVYMYPTKGGIECCTCYLEPRGGFVLLRDAAAALEHIDEHLAAGHSVPPHAITRLQHEAGS